MVDKLNYVCLNFYHCILNFYPWSHTSLIFVCALNKPLEELASLKDETVVDGDILHEDELIDLGEEALLLLGVEHVLQTDKWSESIMCTLH